MNTEDEQNVVCVAATWDTWADRSFGLPKLASAGAAGADLRANFANRESVALASGAWRLISTGLRIELPDGYEAQVRPRSGLANRHGVSVLNAPGTIDSDYRGPLGVILVNFGPETFKIAHGMRIAQLVVAPVLRARFALRDSLSETERGAGGFGSSGVA